MSLENAWEKRQKRKLFLSRLQAQVAQPFFPAQPASSLLHSPVRPPAFFFSPRPTPRLRPARYSPLSPAAASALLSTRPIYFLPLRSWAGLAPRRTRSPFFHFVSLTNGPHVSARRRLPPLVVPFSDSLRRTRVRVRPASAPCCAPHVSPALSTEPALRRFPRITLSVAVAPPELAAPPRTPSRRAHRLPVRHCASSVPPPPM